MANGTRINQFAEEISQINEILIEKTNMEKILILHELLDDTPYKTGNYMQYDLDEYYIKHQKEEIIRNKHLDRIKLVPSENLNRLPLDEVIVTRKSIRDFSSEKVSFEQFSNILFYAFGKREHIRGIYDQRNYPLKFSNTQGGLNHLDIYVVVNNVEDVNEGLYYYDFIYNQLVCLDKGIMRTILAKIHYQSEFVVYAAFNIFIILDLERVVWKYLKRAYRFSHVDTGILLAYLQLVANYHKIGSCAVAGYLEHELENFLGLNEHEIPILSIAFGKKTE